MLNPELPYASAILFLDKCESVLVTQSCPTLFDPVDWSLPGSSVHGILQARILELVAIPFSRESSWPRGWTWVSCIAGRFFTIWATREALLLGINQTEMKTHVYTKTSIWMFLIVLFMAVKKYKQPKCLSAGEQINKVQSTHITEYYLAIKRNEVVTHATTWMNLKSLC